MRKFLYSALIAACGVWVLSPAVHAQGFDMPDFGGFGAGGDALPQATGTVQATVQTYDKAAFFVVTELTLPEHWHVYYKNPGTVGEPLSITMASVPGFEIEGPYWQTPEHGTGFIDFYGYSGRAKLAFKVTPTQQAPEQASFSTTITWQMCAEQCAAPETKIHTVTLKKGTGQIAPNAVELTAGMVGIDIPAWANNLQARITQQDKTVTLHLTTQSPIPAEATVYFFCNRGEINPTQPQKFTKINDTEYELSLPLNVPADMLYPNQLSPQEQQQPLQVLDGILRVGDSGAAIHATVQSTPGTGAPAGEQAGDNVERAAAQTLAADTATAMAQGAESDLGFWTILLWMFVGGIILNVMPCVFPVIGIKIMGFVQLGGGDRRKVFMHALTFVLGILISFWVLTAILLALKAGWFDAEGTGVSLFSGDFWLGTGVSGLVNWAFWLENPWVNLCLLVLMLVMGLSMFGVFEIGVKAGSVGGELQHKKGYAGSFWSGALATVISTPCSAPFLGQAIGAAMLQPPLGIVCCLTMMGLGMALPYIILGAFPGLTDYLPKPGAWMESFKQAMSFLIFGTAAYFLWVYLAFFDAELEPASVLKVFFGLIVIAMACWVYGRWCPLYRAKLTRINGAIIAVICAIIGVWLILPPSAEQDPDEEGSAATTPAVQLDSQVAVPVWQPWSPQAMEQALSAGHPVYVDFTARWCPTCQLNKAAYTEPVEQIWRQHGVVLLKADKTRNNPAIDRELKRLGRTAIPVNALYLPGKAPIVLRELLSTDYLVEFFNQHLPQQ